jgi:hypothetical protein
MRSAIVRIDESRVEVELIDLVKFRPEALGWHFRYPQEQKGQKVLSALLALLALFASLFTIPSHDCYHGSVMEFSQVMC